MKKPILVLSVLLALASCKEEKKEVVGTNEYGDKLVLNEKGDTVLFHEKDTLKTEGVVNEGNSALKKNTDETYSFTYNLEKGKIYPFSLKISQNQSISSAGQNMSMSSSRTVDFDYLVEEKRQDSFVIKATFKGFSEGFKSPTGESLTYNTNSAKPTDKDVAQTWSIYKSITGQSFQMEIDNKGKVVSVSGLEKVVANSEAKLKKDFNAEEQKVLKEVLNSSLSNEAIKAQFEQSFNIFPEKNIKLGEQWSDTQNISEGPVKGTNKVTRTFKEIKNGNAKITINGVQDVSGTETQNGITANMKNHATLEGHIDLDIESGWLKKVSITKKENITNTYQQGEQKQSESGTSTTVTTVN